MEPLGRFFWRIIFEAAGGAINLHQELTWWDVETNTRLGYSRKPLSFEASPPGSVIAELDGAQFDGGVLKCEIDLLPDVEALLMEAGLSFGDFTLGEESISLDGENISIAAEFQLVEEAPEGVYPIFCFPQSSTGGAIPVGGSSPADIVRLAETLDANGRRLIQWAISGQDSLSPTDYGLEKPQGRHRVRVRQDAGASASGDVYEFLVDSIPLIGPTVPAIPATHRFSGNSQTFYIGGNPDGDGFHGKISYLDFDPNSSCASCAG